MRSPRRLRSHTQRPVNTSSIGTMPVADIAIWPGCAECSSAVQRKQPVHEAFAGGARARTALDHHFTAERIDPCDRVAEPMYVAGPLQVIQVASHLPR